MSLRRTGILGKFRMGRRLNTITNTTVASPTYNGNGVTTAFATGFQFIANSDLKVTVTSSTGVESVKVLTTDYTVSGAGNALGGTVTFLAAPASGTKVNITSNVTLDQQTDYVEGGSFSAAAHETALDKLTKITQQLQAQIDRALTLPVSNQSVETTTGVITPGYALRVNDDGDALEWASVTDIALGVDVSDYVETLLDDADAATARTTLGLGTMATQAASSVSITGGSISGITDLALADGGTGASLVDPNADRILFWDDSAGQITWLAPTGNVSITGTSLDATATLDINALTAIGAAVDGANDQLPIYDSSAAANRKVTLNSLITSLTEDTTPDVANDLVLTYDSSATNVKKVKLQNLGTGAAAGQVIQVVQGTLTSTATTTSTTLGDTGLTVSITPSSSSNKVLVIAMVNGGSSTSTGVLKLIRGSTSIFEGDSDGASRTECTASIFPNVSTGTESVTIAYLDSPATTSSTTYKIQFAVQTSGTFGINRSTSDANSADNVRTASSIIVMEVKG